ELLDQLDPDARVVAAASADACTDRAGGQDLDEPADEAGRRSVARVAEGIRAVDIGAVGGSERGACRVTGPAELEVGKAGHAVPVVLAVAAEVAGRAAVVGG